MVTKSPHVQTQNALVELKLHRVVGEISEREAGFAVHAQRRAAKVQFGTRVFVSPQTIGGCHGAVDGGGCPVIDSPGLHRHFAAYVLQAGDARRRIVAECHHR